jgi:hypothetical protein
VVRDAPRTIGASVDSTVMQVLGRIEKVVLQHFSRSRNFQVFVDGRGGVNSRQLGF